MGIQQVYIHMCMFLCVNIDDVVYYTYKQRTVMVLFKPRLEELGSSCLF